MEDSLQEQAQTVHVADMGSFVLFDPHKLDRMVLNIDLFYLLIIGCGFFRSAAAQAESADANTNAVEAGAITHLRLKCRLSSRAVSTWGVSG